MKRAIWQLVVWLGGCNPAAAPEPSASPATTFAVPEGGESAAATPSAAQFHNYNWSQVIANADQHVGASVDVVGKVFAERREGDAWALQIWADFERDIYNTVVAFRATERLAQRGECIRVQGTLGGFVEATNARGATIRLPRVFANRVERVNPVRIQI